jgi:hypothetical protein
MHNPRGADKLDPLVQELAQITAKTAKSRTEEDERRIADLEWRIGIYADDKGKPIVRGNCIRGMIVKGATKARKGKQAQGGVACDDAHLQFPGPKDAAKLFLDPLFRDRRSVRVGTGRVMRTRPIFNTWSLDFSVDIDSDVFGGKELQTALEQGQKVGLLDGRPQFGRFLVKKFEKEALNG